MSLFCFLVRFRLLYAVVLVVGVSSATLERASEGETDRERARERERERERERRERERERERENKHVRFSGGWG